IHTAHSPTYSRTERFLRRPSLLRETRRDPGIPARGDHSFRRSIVRLRQGCASDGRPRAFTRQARTWRLLRHATDDVQIGWQGSSRVQARIWTRGSSRECEWVTTIQRIATGPVGLDVAWR